MKKEEQKSYALMYLICSVVLVLVIAVGSGQIKVIIVIVELKVIMSITMEILHPKTCNVEVGKKPMEVRL